MAVAGAVTAVRIIPCLSGDTKPTNAKVGERVYETNTGKHYVWSGAAWVDFIGGVLWR